MAEQLASRGPGEVVRLVGRALLRTLARPESTVGDQFLPSGPRENRSLEFTFALDGQECPSYKTRQAGC
jgi:hypothetical protein